MWKNFSNEDFERFLKQSADQLRMRPSDKVWRHLATDLRNRRRKVIIVATTFLLSLFTLGFFLVNSPENTSPSATVAQNGPAPSLASAGKRNYIPPAENKVTAKPVSSEQKRTTPPATHNRRISPQQMSNDGSSVVLNNTVLQTNEGSLHTSVALPENIPLWLEPRAANAEVDPPQNTYTFLKDRANTENTTEQKKSTAKSRKLGFQFFFTPTISYRKLSENKSFTRAASPGFVPYLYSYDVNRAVTHKPDMGLELGFAAKYDLARKVVLRGGLQFNVSRYGIRAFSSPYEMATITLSNGQRENTVTGYRNFNGTQPDWIQNFYVQLSAPVGAEFKLGGNEKTQLGIAGTLQPAYLLGDKAYILSSDYKNYVQVPWLVRRWNVAAGAETFVKYSTGKINWQVGPQVRYQLLSSFNSKYPVKENLFDFGLKVGVAVNKNQ